MGSGGVGGRAWMGLGGPEWGLEGLAGLERGLEVPWRAGAGLRAPKHQAPTQEELPSPRGYRYPMRRPKEFGTFFPGHFC